jgi:hypothetical protein
MGSKNYTPVYRHLTKIIGSCLKKVICKCKYQTEYKNVFSSVFQCGCDHGNCYVRAHCFVWVWNEVLTLKEEHIWQVFENKMRGKIFVLKNINENREWRKYITINLWLGCTGHMAGVIVKKWNESKDTLEIQLRWGKREDITEFRR